MILDQYKISLLGNTAIILFFNKYQLKNSIYPLRIIIFLQAFLLLSDYFLVTHTHITPLLLPPGRIFQSGFSLVIDIRR